jgi:hypothetical protein
MPLAADHVSQERRRKRLRYEDKECEKWKEGADQIVV